MLNMLAHVVTAWMSMPMSMNALTLLQVYTAPKITQVVVYRATVKLRGFPREFCWTLC